MLLVATGVFVLAGLGIIFCALQGLRHLAMAMNPRRPAAQRRVRGLFSALFGLGMLGSAAAGYLGIIALMYYASAPGN